MTDATPEDPFGEISTIYDEATWLHECYSSFLAVGFSEEQAFRLTRDKLLLASGGEETDT